MAVEPGKDWQAVISGSGVLSMLSKAERSAAEFNLCSRLGLGSCFEPWVASESSIDDISSPTPNTSESKSVPLVIMSFDELTESSIGHV